MFQIDHNLAAAPGQAILRQVASDCFVLTMPNQGQGVYQGAVGIGYNCFLILVIVIN